MVKYYHMFDFYEKRKIRGLLYSKLTLGILLVLILLLGRSVYERYQVAQQMEVKRLETTAELNELEQRAAVLEGKVEYLEKDRGKEEELRGRFDAAKEGEQVVIIVDEEENTNQLPLDPEENRSWFDVFLFWR